MGNIPVELEFGDDHMSLADTSLGGLTHGDINGSHKQTVPKTRARQLGSFDENSLYTTPYSVKHEEECNLPRSRNASVDPILPRSRTHLENNNWNSNARVSSTLIDHANLGQSSLRQDMNPNSSSRLNLSSASLSMQRSMTVDVKPVTPSHYDGLRITKIDPINPGTPRIQESDAFSTSIASDFDDDFTRDPSEIDVW
jgi:hypothetical protein